MTRHCTFVAATGNGHSQTEAAAIPKLGLPCQAGTNTLSQALPQAFDSLLNGEVEQGEYPGAPDLPNEDQRDRAVCGIIQNCEKPNAEFDDICKLVSTHSLSPRYSKLSSCSTSSILPAFSSSAFPENHRFYAAKNCSSYQSWYLSKMCQKRQPTVCTSKL